MGLVGGIAGGCLMNESMNEISNDYNGPCLILLDRATVAEVMRFGRVDTVSMPSQNLSDEEPVAEEAVEA
jgi:hypothetical protein